MKTKFACILSCFLLFNSCNRQVLPKVTGNSDSIRIAFGSCNDLNHTQHLWDDIISLSPHLWIWLGDIIYADTEDMIVMKALYDMQKAIPEYAVLSSSTRIMGIWDDHDYGVNNGGKEYPQKDASRDLLFDFLGIPESDKDWQHSGAYNEEIINIEGLNVHVILLDARYFRDSVHYDNRKPVPNYSGSILGEAQWEWLQELLANSPADVFVIGSGIQIIPEEHNYEKWANFPDERGRLLNLVSNLTVPVILLSGDRHIGEFSVYETTDKPKLVEVTSSGMTHSWLEAKEENKWREGPLVTAQNFGYLEISRSQKGALTIDVKILSENNKPEAGYTYE